MSFPECLNVKTPDAEDRLMTALQTRNLLRFMEVKDTVILFYPDRIEFVDKDSVTPRMVEASLGYTIPDAMPRREYGTYPIYLDGPPHRRDGIRRRDEWVNKMWHARGVEPWRYPYQTRLPKRKIREICDRVEEVINKK